MFVVKCGPTVFFDVDDTLVMWDATPEELETKGIVIEYPIQKVYNYKGVQTRLNIREKTVMPHQLHIKKLIEHKLRNHTVVVWSAGGSQWAEAVVRTLGLTDYVDLVVSKPNWCYDDLTAAEFIPTPIWIDNNLERE